MILLPFTHHSPQGYERHWKSFKESLEGMDSSGEGCFLALLLPTGMGGP